MIMGLDRVIVLIDMDCFYVQVEQRDKPELKGKPCAVVQYKTYKGGGTIAVSYEARDHGVKRGMMGEEAQKLCPEIQLVRVPVQRDKADLTKYRDAGAEVINVLMQFSKKVERASIDEAYIDLTEEVDVRLSQMGQGSIHAEMLPFTHVAGWEDGRQEENNKDEARTPKSKEDIRRDQLYDWLSCLNKDEDKRLAVGAIITEEMREAVLQQTKFNCSAGIAHNKMLAKLVCGLNKPRKQSVLPHDLVPILFKDLPISKVRGLGGKLGVSVSESLNAVNMGDLLKFSEAELQAKIGPKAGVWLYNICRGFEDEPVRPRQLAKSVGCSKNFLGKSCLDTVEKVRFWLGQLSEEVAERLQKEESLNNRMAKSMCVYVRQQGNPPVSVTRSCALHSRDPETLSRTALSLIQGLNRAGSHQAAWMPAILNLGLSTTKFADVPEYRGDNGSLDKYFNNQSEKGLKTETNTPVSQKATRSQQQLESFFTKKAETETGNIANASTQSPGERESINGHSSKGKLPYFFKKSPNVDENRAIDTSSEISSEYKRSEGEFSKNQEMEINWGEVDEVRMGRVKRNVAGEVIDKARNGTKASNSPLQSFFRTKATALPNSTELMKVNEMDETKRSAKDVERSKFDSSVVHVLSKENKNEEKLGHNLSLLDDTDFVTCDQCQDKISPWELPEHLDFHVAMALQEQENGLDMPSSSSSPAMGASISNTRSGKRKGAHQLGQPASSKKSKIDSSNKTLHSFFSQK